MAAPARSRSRAFALGLSLALGWVIWCAWVHRGHWVDDAFISFRYAANWLGGEGLVFNPGERVEGVTNLGWVWLLAGARAVVPVGLPVLAKWLGGLCLVGAVTLVALAYRRLVPEAAGLELALLPVLVVSSPELVYFSLAGMETGLAALLLATALWSLAGERPRLVPAALACGALLAVRPEALPLFPLFAIVLLVRPEVVPRARVLLALGLFAAVVVAVTAFRLGYYGAALPNTFVAKSPGEAGELAQRAWAALVGRLSNLPAPWVGSVLLAIGGGGATLLWATGRRRPATLFLILGVLTGIAFAVYAPADWTLTGRYFAPWVPFAVALVVRGLFGGLARVLPPERSRSAAAAAALIALLFTAIGLWRGQALLGRRALGEYPGFVLASDTLIEPARWIGEWLPPGTTIASRRIGALGYFGRRPVLDYAFGLTDPEVARLRRARGTEPFATPDDAALAEVWTRERPDCLLEDRDVITGLRPRPLSPALVVHGLPYEEVRSFPLGNGATDWVLACRAGSARAADPFDQALVDGGR